VSEDLATFGVEAEALSGILDSLDYFQVLKIPQTATPTEIKNAYHRESRVYHPDRVFHVDDAQLKNRVNQIYKRVTEAYFVLRDERKRTKYLADINGEYRLLKLRYDEIAEQEVKKSMDEEIGKTPNGRKFYGAGLADLQAGRLEAAERNLKMALMYEPQNAKFKDRLEEVQKQIKPKGFSIGK
jgi:curved DNA-binding protein CbpA